MRRGKKTVRTKKNRTETPRKRNRKTNKRRAIKTTNEPTTTTTTTTTTTADGIEETEADSPKSVKQKNKQTNQPKKKLGKSSPRDGAWVGVGR